METTRQERRSRRAVEKRLAGPEARQKLIDAMPVTERRIELGGIPTAVLEGGAGPPVVLLHGPGEFAAKWFTVIPDLVATHRVIAPDLPGHGASGGGDSVEGERVLAWLGELIARTCPVPPALVGQIVGGAIAARFAARSGERVERLVLVDALGLAAFEPAAEFGRRSPNSWSARPPETLDRLWARCAFDLDACASGSAIAGRLSARTPWIGRPRRRRGPPCRASWRRSGCRPSRKPSSRRSWSPRS